MHTQTHAFLSQALICRRTERRGLSRGVGHGRPVACTLALEITKKWAPPLQGSAAGADLDFRGALGASAQFLHAQRSGALTDAAVSWRGGSGLADVPTGGFYLGSSARPAPGRARGARTPGRPRPGRALHNAASRACARGPPLSAPPVCGSGPCLVCPKGPLACHASMPPPSVCPPWGALHPGRPGRQVLSRAARDGTPAPARRQPEADAPDGLRDAAAGLGPAGGRRGWRGRVVLRRVGLVRSVSARLPASQRLLHRPGTRPGPSLGLGLGHAPGATPVQPRAAWWSALFSRQSASERVLHGACAVAHRMGASRLSRPRLAAQWK